MDTTKRATGPGGPSILHALDASIPATGDNTRELCRWYELGIQHERERAAVAGHDDELSWGRTVEQLHRDRKAERMRQMEQAAERFHERELGRAYVEYKGGAVTA